VLGDFGAYPQNALMDIPEGANDLALGIQLIHAGGRGWVLEQRVDREQLESKNMPLLPL